MKLLLAASLYPPEARGPSTFAGQLVEHLTTQGIAVEVVKFRDVRKLPFGIRHVVYFCKLLSHGRGATIVLALDPISTGLPALWASRLLGAKFVLRVGGDYAWEQGAQRFGIADTLDIFVAREKSSYPFSIRLLWRVQAYVACHAAAIVVPSRYLKGIVERWGVPPGRIEVLYSAIAHASGLSHEEARNKLKMGDEPVVFSLGALVPWKGFPVLIDAIAQVRRRFPNVKFIVAGEGPLKSKLIQQALHAGLGEVFLGDIPNAQVLEHLRAADVFALNTGYEGLSHVLIEAMMSAVPMVTTPVGGNPELIEDGSTGRLVPVNNKEAFVAVIEELLADKESARLLGEKARTRANELFSAEKSMRGWEKLLHTV